MDDAIKSGMFIMPFHASGKPLGGSGADRIVGAIRPGVRRGEAAYAAMT